MAKVELYEKVRLARRDEGLSIRALATRFGVHRREVRAALASPEPTAHQSWSGRPLAGAWHGWIRDVLVADCQWPC